MQKNTKEGKQNIAEVKNRLKLYYDRSIFLHKTKERIIGLKHNLKNLPPEYNTDLIKGMYNIAIKNNIEKYEKLKPFIEAETQNIKAAINLLKNEKYKLIMYERYINLKAWKEIILSIFANRPDVLIEYSKKYHFFIQTWHRRAISQISTQINKLNIKF